MAETVGGYDYKYITEVPEDLICSLCHFPFKDPIHIEECGHIYCEECFEQTNDHAAENALDFCCPLDRSKIDVTRVFKDKLHERKVLSLKVECRNLPDRCSWTGELIEAIDHKEKCGKNEKMVSVSESFEIEFKKVSSHVTELDNKVKCLEQGLEDKDKQLDNQNKQMEKQMMQMENYSKQLEDQRKQMVNQKKQVENCNKQIEDQNKLIEDQNKLMEKQKKQMENCSVQMEDEHKLIDENKNKQMGNQMKQVENYSKQLEDQKKLMEKQKKQVENYSKQLEDQKQIDNDRKKLYKQNKVITIIITVILTVDRKNVPFDNNTLITFITNYSLVVYNAERIILFYHK